MNILALQAKLCEKFKLRRFKYQKLWEISSASQEGLTT